MNLPELPERPDDALELRTFDRASGTATFRLRRRRLAVWFLRAAVGLARANGVSLWDPRLWWEVAPAIFKAVA